MWFCRCRHPRVGAWPCRFGAEDKKRGGITRKPPQGHEIRFLAGDFQVISPSVIVLVFGMLAGLAAPNL